MMSTPGSMTDRMLTRTTTYPPSRRTSIDAPGGARAVATTAATGSPRAANRAASRAASIQRSCVEAAAMPATQNTRTATKVAMASAASIVLKPPSPARPWCSARA